MVSVLALHTMCSSKPSATWRQQFLQSAIGTSVPYQFKLASAPFAATAPGRQPLVDPQCSRENRRSVTIRLPSLPQQDIHLRTIFTANCAAKNHPGSYTAYKNQGHNRAEFYRLCLHFHITFYLRFVHKAYISVTIIPNSMGLSNKFRIFCGMKADRRHNSFMFCSHFLHHSCLKKARLQRVCHKTRVNLHL